MALFVQGSRRLPRRFSYEPRYYKPDKDENLKRRMRIQSKTRRRNPAGLIYFAALLAMVLYIYSVLS